MAKGGIFIIETKGWKGKIIGNLDDKKWTQNKKYHLTKFSYGYNAKELDNPIQQNKKHLENFLKIWKNICSEIPKMTSIVIFPDLDLENLPKGTYNIQSACSLITKLSVHGNYNVEKIENVISKIIQRYGGTEADHNKTWNQLEQKHEA